MKNQKLVIITGPMAVGKMAVGLALEAMTELKLFHNHMTIEPVIRLFPYGSKEGQYLISKFRTEIFETMAASDFPGMIFTYVWAFDIPDDYEAIRRYVDIFEQKGADIYIVELEASLEERLRRNETPLRLGEKPSKRNLEWSKNNMIELHQTYRLNSLPGEVPYDNYLRIDNTHLSPNQVAEMIVNHFKLNETVPSSKNHS